MQQLLACVDKCIHTMVETPAQGASKVVLEVAPVSEDSMSRRFENIPPSYLAECERLIVAWSNAIENVLTDAFEDRFVFRPPFYLSKQ